MAADPWPDAPPPDAPGRCSLLGDAAGRVLASIVDLVDPVGWAVEIIGGLVGLLA